MKLTKLGVIGDLTPVELILPNDMFWVDEFKWQPAVSTKTYSLTGALIIEGGVRLAGRPISLEPKNDMAWIPRSTVLTLRSWAALFNRKLELKLEYPTDTRVFTVVFDTQLIAVEASAVKEFPQHRPDDWFSVKLRFIEVEA